MIGIHPEKRVAKMKKNSRGDDLFGVLFENSPDAILILDGNTFIDCNRAALEMLGYERKEQLIGLHPAALSPEKQPDGRNSFELANESVNKALETGSLRLEWSHIRSSGEEFPVEVLLTAVPFKGQKVLFTVWRDISVRKKTEKALRDSEEKYRLLVENAIEAVYVVQGQAIKYANSETERIFGYSKEQLAAMPISRLVHPDDRAMVVERSLARQSGLERPSRYPFRVVTASGETRWVELNVIRMQWEGKPATLNYLSDITSRKMAEEALRMSEEKFSKSFENSPMIMTLTEIEDGTILDVNRKFCEVSGYEKDEVIGKTTIELGWMSRKTRDKLTALGRKGPVTGIEAELAGKGGRKILVDYHGGVVSIGGQKRYLSYSLDVTEIKRAGEEHRRLQERLQRAEKMEALGTLAGGVAHDLNNVMGIVLGYAELLTLGVDKTNPIRPKLVNILDAGRRAAAIVQDLLTLARRGVYDRKVLNLNEIVSGIWKSPEFEMLRTYHPAVEIKTMLDPDLLNLSGSRLHLGKSLFNLVSNASEAMPKGGTVTIRTANRYLDKPVQGYDQILEGDYVVLSVSDTGEGIAQEDLKRVFEPFYTKKIMGRSGTGLGLAVVWGTIKDHNGYINVNSEPGKGSTFTLYFPVTREEIAPESVSVSRAEYMGRGETILVVDDIQGQRELAATILGTLNYKVACVSSGEEAVAYLKEHRADLLVLDMIMDPGMDGLDTYRKVLEINPKQKAIIVSGFSESDRVRAAQELGAGAYVRKPYVIEKLGLALKAELERS